MYYTNMLLSFIVLLAFAVCIVRYFDDISCMMIVKSIRLFGVKIDVT